MNCPNCGTSNLDNATICANCGRPLSAVHSSYTPPPPPPPAASYRPAAAAPAGAVVPNYLWQSIVVTLCCCLPFGIVAIIFAAKVNNELAVGNIAGAQAASKTARMWVIIAVVSGLVAWVIWMVSIGAGVLQGYRDSL